VARYKLLVGLRWRIFRPGNPPAYRASLGVLETFQWTWCPNTEVLSHKIFSGRASIWLVSITCSGAIHPRLTPGAACSPSCSGAQVLFSHLFLPVLQPNRASWYQRRVKSFPSSLDDDAQVAQFMDMGPQIGPILPETTMTRLHPGSRDEGFSHCLVTRSLKYFSLPLCWFQLTFQ
jgi:hypothetical protein